MNQQEMRNAIEGSAQVAQLIVNYYYELKQCGLDDKEALQVAIAYQHSILTMNNE